MEPSQLDALLKFLIDTLKESKDFTIDQAPQFVRQALAWRFWEAAIFGVFWVGAALIAGTLGAQWLGGWAEEDDGKEFGQKVRRVVRMCAVGAALLAVCAQGCTMAKIKVAPRIVVIDIVRETITGKR